MQRPKYDINQTLWVADIKHTTEEVACPVCNGYKVIYLENTDGVRWEFDCRYCAPGFDPPTGTVTETWYWAANPLFLTVSGIEWNVQEREYQYTFLLHHSGHYSESICFEERLEAEKASEQLAMERNQYELDIRMKRKENDRKSYSYHVGYHTREAKKAREQVDYHEKKARYMQGKVRKSNV